jgi:Family of unknown function (DUF6112)
MSTVLAAARQLAGAAGVDITPNTTGLPGVAQLETIVGTLIVVAVIAAVAGLLISATVWAIGNHSSNPQLVSRGKTGVLVAAVAAVLAGGAMLIVNFFFSIGQAL